MTEINNQCFFEEFEYPTVNEWRDAAEKALKGVPFDKVMFTPTYEDIVLKPIYTKEDTENLEHLKSDIPGFFPNSRQPDVTGYINHEWEIAQNLPYCIPEEYNKALKSDLNVGQNSIKMSFDRAVVMHEDFIFDDLSGYDLAIANIADFETALKDIDITKYPINLYSGTGSIPLAALLSAYCKKNNIDLKSVKGSFNFDMISDLCNEGELSADLNTIYNEMALLTKWSVQNCPKFHTIYINGSVFHNGGANSVQELSYSFAAAVNYINEMQSRGLTIDEIAPRIAFNLSIGVNFFMEISKLRSARIVWAKIIREFGGSDESCKMHIRCETSEREMTKYDPNVNMLRSTSQAFSAISGGCDALTVRFYDEYYGFPSDFSRRIARNTQNVLKFESHLTDTIDPAGGSWYIEALTAQFAEKVWGIFTEIEKKGGILEALKSEYIQNEIDKVFKKRLANLASRKDVILGTNKYPNLFEKPVENVYELDLDKLADHIDKYDAAFENRDNELIDSLLDDFERLLIENNPEAMDIAADAALVGASLGEIYCSLIHGNESDIKIVPILPKRGAEIFELLRENALEYKESVGNYPILNFMCFGNLKDYKGRADFANDFFQVGGFLNKIIDGNFNSPDAILKINDTESNIFVICSTDDIYAQVVPEFAFNLKELIPDCYIVLAGYPKDKVEEYKSAGVDMFIHIKSDIVECLQELQKVAGLID